MVVVAVVVLGRGNGGVRRQEGDGVPDAAGLLVPDAKEGRLDRVLLAPRDAVAGQPAADVVRGKARVPAHGDGAVAVEAEDGPEDSPPLLLLRPVLRGREEHVGLD